MCIQHTHPTLIRSERELILNQINHACLNALYRRQWDSAFSSKPYCPPDKLMALPTGA